MSTLLYLQASPRGERSKSGRVGNEFAHAYREHHPGDEVRTLNLFETDLMPFDGLAVRAKYTVLHGDHHTGEERAAWAEVERVARDFASADKYLLTTPMWNFGIPYRLKQYIDIIVQPGLTFSFSPEAGYQGLVTGKPILVVYARGGDYAAEASRAVDLQKQYMELILGFIGFTDIRSIVIEPTLAGGAEVAQQKTAAAMERARQMAIAF